MSEIKDDPREVLVLLNSLGFVGITAAQLKAFMKDLKIYRKIKEREKQQRKEEIKTKIISKQQAVIKEAYGHRNTDYSLNNIVPSESSNSLDDKALIKLRIRCISKEENIQRQKHPETTVMSLDKRPLSTNYKKDVQIAESDKMYFEQDCVKDKSCSNIKSCESKNRQDISKYPVKSSHLIERCKYNLRIEEQEKSVTSTHEHPANEPILSNHVTRPRSKSAASNPTENLCVQSTLSARSSVLGQKSFIRPWRLQPKAQKNVGNKKCDPVALYQKYQQEWKQISFPGEAKHSKLRWAVREKMLGADPHPLPLPKKSTSMPILKRK